MSENHDLLLLAETPDDSGIDGDTADERSASAEPGRESRQMQAALALAEGKTETETARLVGVNRTTIYRWNRQAHFVADVNRLKREYLREHRAKMRSLVSKATKTVDACLDLEDSNPLKLKAAMFVLSTMAPTPLEPVGPTTAEAVEKQWKDEKIRLISYE
jgi:Helix-turn-helix of insertion element transposase